MVYVNSAHDETFLVGRKLHRYHKNEKKRLHGKGDDEKPFANLKKTLAKDYDAIVVSAEGKDNFDEQNKEKVSGLQKKNLYE